MTTKEFLEIEKQVIKDVVDEFGDDGWDLKQYVLGLLFYRFLSEKIVKVINSNQKKAGAKTNNYSELDDKTASHARKELIEEIGYFLLPSELFENVQKNSQSKENLNEIISSIFRGIESSAIGTLSENNFKGLFAEFNVNSELLGNTVDKRNKKLSKYLNLVAAWELSISPKNIYGDIFESLIGTFASKAGKKGGNFFTPKEVSELMVALSLIDNKVRRVYDPACGSGSLVLKYSGNLNSETKSIEYFGQDENLTFYNFCRINMLLHDIDFDGSFISHGDTLENPRHLDESKFDAIVSNPRFSKEWKGDSDPLLINDPRFSPAGVLAPKGKHDMAFIMHTLFSLNTKGVAVLAEHPGVMYRGNAEQKIRKYLIENNYIDCVIQLPADLFFGVPIAPNLLILKKSRKGTAVFFVNASNYFERNGNKNRITLENRKSILDIVSSRQDIEFVAKNVTQEIIAENKYLLTVSAYVKELEVREIIDIKKLNNEISEIVRNQSKLRKSIDAIVSDLEGVSS